MERKSRLWRVTCCSGWYNLLIRCSDKNCYTNQKSSSSHALSNPCRVEDKFSSFPSPNQIISSSAHSHYCESYKNQSWDWKKFSEHHTTDVDVDGSQTRRWTIKLTSHVWSRLFRLLAFWFRWFMTFINVCFMVHGMPHACRDKQTTETTSTRSWVMIKMTLTWTKRHLGGSEKLWNHVTSIVSNHNRSVSWWQVNKVLNWRWLNPGIGISPTKNQIETRVFRVSPTRTRFRVGLYCIVLYSFTVN